VSPVVRLRRLGYRIAYCGLQVLWFLRRPHTRGVKCLLSSGDLVLLVRHTYGRRVWDLPGGKLKRGEPPLEAARREILEELGVAPLQWWSAGTIHGSESFRHDTVHCFGAVLACTTVHPNLAELAAVRWFSRSALPQEIAPRARALLEAHPGAPS
jgi:8-oxo-dGTP pyrophosphatase MutT (NUDIX family)